MNFKFLFAMISSMALYHRQLSTAASFLLHPINRRTTNYSLNRYLYRYSFQLFSKSSLSSTSEYKPSEQLVYAKNLMKRMASERTLQRFAPVFDLAVYNNELCHTCVDVGCDHGLLTISLGATGIFNNVVGIDVSEQALQNGALVNFDRVKILASKLQHLLPPDFPSNLTFKVGNGLKDSNFGQNTTVCICGMGVHTMIDIIFPPNACAEMKGNNVYNRFVLQPTNSKPRNLISIYDRLQNAGYVVEQEQITLISSRFYFTTSFAPNLALVESSIQQELPSPMLPGEFLLKNKSEIKRETLETFYEYVKFHHGWIGRDKKSKQILNTEDERWLSVFSKI